ncbi:GNAT family N-acetyltransferase [Mycobacterium sp. E3247]|uniref:GNAT family N-acetyltransferase n=1 Tax=Mycobacterium sp. E3247 TaxID=1856864 RepID=UPI0012EAACB6|nr:GNAT family N-acetyltransferase [Mycobacterium sp. E3247]
MTTQRLLTQGGIVAHTPGYQGVITWLPATCSLPSEDESAAFLDLLQDSVGPCGPRVRILMEELDRRHPQDLPPHFYVVCAAITPAMQKSGLVKRAEAGIRERLRAEGTGGYTEASSPSSMLLWQYMGMKRIGDEIRLPDGGPSLYPLYMDASDI